jgi:hypothetical protein
MTGEIVINAVRLGARTFALLSVPVVGVTLAGSAFAATGTQGAAASSGSVVALWHMSDTNGGMVDSSGYGNNASKVRNVTQGAAGSSGKGFQFYRSPAVVVVPDDATLDPGDGKFSVTIHFRGTTLPPLKDFDLIRKGAGSTAGGDYKIEILHTGRAFCFYRDENEDRASLTKGPNLVNGAWHTIVCARTSTGIKLTVDGSSWTKSAPLAAIANSSSLSIGAKESGGDQTIGDLDEVTIKAG